MIKVRELSSVNIRRERTHSLCIRFFCCKSHCKICSSVECTREADDAFSSCICFGYLYCILICLCTAVCKECFQFITFARHKFVEPISKFNVTTVCHHIENAVKIFFCLILNSFHDLRSAVADVENADTSDKIKKDVSVNIFEHCALSTLDTYRICIATERFRQCVVPFFQKYTGIWSWNLICNYSWQ